MIKNENLFKWVMKNFTNHLPFKGIKWI
jgi:hypothetical protein